MSALKHDPAGRLLNKMGAAHEPILQALVTIRGAQRITDQNPEAKYQGARALCRRFDRGGPTKQARPPSSVAMKRFGVSFKSSPEGRRTTRCFIGRAGCRQDRRIVEGLALRIVKGDVPETPQE